MLIRWRHKLGQLYDNRTGPLRDYYLVNWIIHIDLSDLIYLNSELYDFRVTAIFENILPACHVIDLFHLRIKQTQNISGMTRGN
jgi:hypothetical protein